MNSSKFMPCSYSGRTRGGEMTNGEKLKEVFPDIQIFNVTENELEEKFIHIRLGGVCQAIELDWWNAEYQEPVIRDNEVKGELNRVKDELEPTTKNCETCKYNGAHHGMCKYCYKCSLWTEQEPTTKNDCAEQNGCITCSLDDGDDCCRKLYEESMKEPTTKNNLGVDREDAVERLNAIKQLIGYDKDSEIVKATQKSLDMAIKALEQEPRKDEVILTNKEYRELMTNEYDHGYCKGYAEALEEQEPVLDRIRAEIDNALSDGMIHKKTVLGIIDKYKAEQEET